MKKHLIKSAALGLVCFGAGLAPMNGQVILNPNQISGTLRFTNANPAILSLLQPPGNEGMSNVYVSVSSVPPAPYISASTDYLPTTSFTSANYQITVESGSPGISYSVAPVVLMGGDLYTYQSAYYFSNLVSAPVMIGAPPPPLDFDECVGVVTVQFVTPLGDPVAVDGGKIYGYDPATGAYTGDHDPLPAGVSEQRIYLRGGMTHRLDITIHQGTNFYTDRIEGFLSTNVLVTCDQFTTVQMVVPDAGVLGTVTGTVGMQGKFELTVPGTYLDYPDYTSVIARYGPFLNQRWGALNGSNFTIPSSGAYTLSNVAPSTLDPLSTGYQVLAQMVFGSNRTIQTFFTPALGSGANAPLAVLPGDSLDLGNTFQIKPGYLGGRIFLQGPAESPGRASLLRGVLHAGDDSTDGIPNYLGTYGVYWSAVEADGVDRLASGATLTASQGSAAGDFDGAFNPASNAYEGQYQLALGGLKGENSLWRRDYLTLTLDSGTVTNDNDYYYNVLTIGEAAPAELEIAPAQSVTSDIGYCLSEVTIVFRSTEGTFYAPHVSSSSGTFATNADFQGHPAAYTVYLDAAYGTPVSSLTASNIGQVVMYLPQGTYRLYPAVTPGTGTYALTGLEPLDITVGCGQKIAIEPCLQLSLDAPVCTNQWVGISGSVRSCGNPVSSITYTLNGGPPQTVCNNCGADPLFAFNVLLATECLDNTLTVTATDASGGTSSVTSTIHYDVTPPVIQCPTNLVVSSCDTNGVAAFYTVTATDNCSGPVTVACTPPSGSLFPVGATTVNCVATDGCGNTSQCSFTVTVGGSELTVERAIIIRWNCGGTLQSADNLTGPWTDLPGATSPYAVATSAERKFYRVRN